MGAPVSRKHTPRIAKAYTRAAGKSDWFNVSLTNGPGAWHQRAARRRRVENKTGSNVEGMMMTVPYERTQAVLRTRELLKELAFGESDNLDALRRRAKALLKHFPVAADMDASAAALPAVWATSFTKGRAG